MENALKQISNILNRKIKLAIFVLRQSLIRGLSQQSPAELKQ